MAENGNAAVMRASLKRGLLDRYPALRSLPDAEVERLLDEGAVRELPRAVDGAANG